MKELEQILQPIKQWKESYNDLTLEEEGYSWEITFVFLDGKVTSAGFEDVPKNYETVRKAVEEWFEKLVVV